MPKRRMHTPGNKGMILMDWNLRLSSHLLWFIMPLNQQGTIIGPDEMSGLVYKGKIELLLHSGGQEGLCLEPRRFDKNKTSKDSNPPMLQRVRGRWNE